MREIMPYIWIGIIIFSAAAGVNTASRAQLRIIPAGLAAFVFSLAGAEVWQQAVIFFILAPVFLVLSHALLRKIAKLRTPAASRIVGRTAIVTQEINNYKQTGEIRLNGAVHAARAEESDIIYEPGLVVTVIRLEGLKAVCTR